jgi:nitrogen fixation NifU-like protein
MNPYGSIIEEHSRHPRNYGALESPDLRSEAENPLCGDRIRIELSIRNGTVATAQFQGDLCVIGKAAGSLLTEMLTGLPLEAAAGLPEERLIGALNAEIKPSRRRCALLPLEALQQGITEYNESRRTK